MSKHLSNILSFFTKRTHLCGMLHKLVLKCNTVNMSTSNCITFLPLNGSYDISLAERFACIAS